MQPPTQTRANQQWPLPHSPYTVSLTLGITERNNRRAILCMHLHYSLLSAEREIIAQFKVDVDIVLSPFILQPENNMLLFLEIFPCILGAG